MDEPIFEWDETKNAANRRKHGVSFEEARSAFADKQGRLAYDLDHSETEDRFVLMGMSDRLRILVVCHCEIDAKTIRIISARPASPHERRQYEELRHA